MLFNSYTFIFVFWPIVALVYLLAGRFSHTFACIWLCAASLFFYGYWNANYLWLLGSSIVFNYAAGYWIGHARQKASWWVLTAAVSGNLLLLGYYKYCNFFVSSVDSVWGTKFSMGDVILPLGISFFTFTQIAFLVDTYRGKAKEYNFIHYLLFVSYFPHLIAGPILHHAQMMPQFALAKTYKVNWNNMAIGLTFFIIGLMKKVWIADAFYAFVHPIFDEATVKAPFILDAWIGAYAYALELYFDFSGYCDMAIGISYIFNIKLPFNFNSPYKAPNIIDFWRRWHMTLSSFLRDYLYIPLGGNRHGSTRRYVNLMLTMLLGGLWHGAGWTFVLWGGLHGLFLAVNHAFQELRKRIGWREGYLGPVEHILSVGLTFICVLFAWVVFRANNFTAAENLIFSMVGYQGLTLETQFLVGFSPLLAIGAVLIWLLPNTQQWMGLDEDTLAATGGRSKVPTWLAWNPDHWWTWLFLGVSLGISIILLSDGTPSPFLYFQF